MQFLIKQLSKNKNKIKFVLVTTFSVCYAFINILMVFLLGIENLSNETLSNNDLAQFITLVSSMILIIVICIVFLQYIISVEIRTLFLSRRVFNINIRLMGLSSKELKRIYINEIISLQKTSVPIGILLTLFSTYFISKFTEIPNTNLIIMIISSLLYAAILISTLVITINKLVKPNIISEMRNDTPLVMKKNYIGKIMNVFGILTLGLFVYLKIIKNDYSDIFLLASLILLNRPLIHFFNKVILFLSDKLKISEFSMAGRLLLSDFKRTKNLVFVFSLGIMLFIGLQTMFETARYNTKKVGEDNLYFSEILDHEGLENDDKAIFTVEKKVTIKNIDVNKKVLKGIGTDYFKAENIVFDQNLSDFTNKNLFDEKNWNGIIAPNAVIASDNIGQKITILVENKEIEFVILGGYFQNTFTSNTWLASKNYILQNLSENKFTNKKYVFKHENNENITLKSDLIDDSVRKVISSTEPVVITSMIVVLVAIFSIFNSFILQSNVDTLNIAKMRAMGVHKRKIFRIYYIYISLILVESFGLGLLYSAIFSRICLTEMLSIINRNIVYQIPITPILILFLTSFSILIISFTFINKKAFKSEFISLTRSNTF